MQVRVTCSNKTSLQPVSKTFEQHFLYFKTAEEKVICLQTGEKTRQVYKGVFSDSPKVWAEKENFRNSRKNKTSLQTAGKKQGEVKSKKY